MNTIELKDFILSSKADERLSAFYSDIDSAKKRISSLCDAHFAHFSPKTDAHIFSAPGRTEICGNHTDHQHGKVIAAAVDLDIMACVTRNDQDVIHINSKGYKPYCINTKALCVNQAEYGSSTALVRGMCAGLVEHGHRIGGFDATIYSTVPSGSGLSSSAAFEVLIGRILAALYNDNQISAEGIAQIGAFSENEYFGKPSGLMDQTACSVGGCLEIDFYDTNHPKIENLPFDPSSYGYDLIITDCHSSHANLTDEYAAVPAEMSEVSKLLGENYLAMADETEFYKNLKKIREQTSDRALLRTIHFFEENKRVSKLAHAIRNNDILSILKTITLSGNSSFKYLQNVYSIKSTDKQAVSLALALSDKLVGENGAVRVHGGGFAGTIQAYVKASDTQRYITALESVIAKGCCHKMKIRKIGSEMII